MRKQVRRTIMLALAVILAMTAPIAGLAATETTASSPAARTSSPEVSMETALLAVKGIISIDENIYTDFSYSSSYSNQQTREGLVWSFNWSDTQNSSIYAYVTDDGTLLQFRKYDYGRSMFGFADISRDKAADAAQGFLKKANPDTWSYYSRQGDPEVSINYSEYSFDFVAKVNGHDFSAASISVDVNKFTGEVTSYYTSNLSPKSYTFESAPKLIGADAAVTAYADKIGLSLEYRSYYEYEAKKLNVFPVYLMDVSGIKYISAVTGDVVEYVYDRGENDMNGGAAYDASAPSASQSESSSAGRGLTPQEVAAIEKASGFISSEQALNKLLAVMELDIDAGAYDESYISLNSDYINRDKYVYNISLYANDYERIPGGISSINGRVDAETGRVLSFSYYYDMNSSADQKMITEGQATTIVNKFLTANAPEELKKTKLDSIQPPVEEKYYGNQSYYFSYCRVENGAPFRQNGIWITLDARTGKITGYSLDWYENITFPSVANVLTPGKALAGYVAQNGVQTDYITVGEGKANLVYDFGVTGYLDPFTGKTVNYNGEKQPDAVQPDYSDVKGHWSESYVGRLLENGVYQWGGKFEPERVMTQLEFLQYIMTLEPYYHAQPLQYFKDQGITTDIKADDKTPVTRQEAARIIAEYMGYGKLASMSKWFAYPFAGAVDEAYKGYITVCCALGIINGTGGEYNAKASVARAEAAVMLHNLILAKS